MSSKSRQFAIIVTVGVIIVVAIAVYAVATFAGRQRTTPALADETTINSRVEEATTETVAQVADETSAADEEVAEALAAEEEVAPEALAVEEKAAPAVESEVTIFTEDDRPSRLQGATASWNTNWNKHTIQYDELLSGGPPRDGIPSIDDPQFVSPGEAEEWLADNEPVIALEINGDAHAYPLQILTWHEIVNDVVGEVPVAVTFCPLCNSALTFDRRFNDQVFEFGTSGLLRNSDLVMYDRTTETLWQQFTGEGIVGDLAGEQLEFIPSSIIGFGDFRAAHPDGVVLSRETGFARRYGENPYVGYDQIGNNPFLFRGPIDGRLAAMERVVTVSLDNPSTGPGQSVDVAYPLSILSEVGVINDTQGRQDMVVFHVGGTSSALGARVIAQAEDVGATGVFDPNLNGQKLTFKKDGDKIVDEETGSTWNIVGRAIDGPLAGEQLTQIVSADHFWFSWAAFKPDTIIYGS